MAEYREEISDEIGVKLFGETVEESALYAQSVRILEKGCESFATSVLTDTVPLYEGVFFREDASFRQIRAFVEWVGDSV